MIKNKLLNLFTIILIAFLLTNCGFKIKNNSINFKLTEIITEGDRKINFTIKNSLLNNSNNVSVIQKKIILNTTKKKSIAEKNIQNEITKYKIKINSKITLIDLTNEDTENFSITKDGLYSVGDTYSVSLNNEKKLINLLVISLKEEILEKLAEVSNDI